eukprot:3942008-Rhodomonas_salina.1
MGGGLISEHHGISVPDIERMHFVAPYQEAIGQYRRSHSRQQHTLAQYRTSRSKRYRLPYPGSSEMAISVPDIAYHARREINSWGMSVPDIA